MFVAFQKIFFGRSDAGSEYPLPDPLFFWPGHRFDNETPVQEVVRVAATISGGARAY